MTPELIERLQQGQRPFDGWTVQSEAMALADLRRTVAIVGEGLRTLSGSVEIVWFKDWFFHDECPSQPCRFTWEEFDRLVSYDAQAKSFCVGDDLCAFAIFPDDALWLFRIDVPEAQETPDGWRGNFDLTVPLPLARTFVESLAPLPLSFEPATHYFVPSWCR